MLDFDFTKKYILENDFVRISPLEMQDVDSLSEISEESGVWTYFLENGRGKKRLSSYIHSAICNRKMRKEYPFVIFDKTQNAFAGTTRLCEINLEQKTLKIGHTWYGKNFRGTGLNKHCKYLLFEFAFETVDVARIGFGVHADNARSIKALESVGCIQEGVLRDFLNNGASGDRADLVLMGILKKEWTDCVKKNLNKKLDTKHKSR